MKKTICLLVVFALTAPLFGAKVDFVVTDVGSCQVQIGYANDGVPEADLPVGLALKVVVSGGNVTGLVSVDPCHFLVYLDAASDDPCTYNIGDATPLAASETVPGELTSFPVTTLYVCMGRLDPCAAGPNPGPDAVANLVTLQLADTDADDKAYVSVYEDTVARGGVVGSDPCDLPTNLPVEDVEVICGPVGPACWMDPVYGTRQCNGDYNDLPDDSVDSADFIALKNAYGSVFGAGNYNPCPDSDRNGTIDSTDFIALKNHYGETPVTADCTPGDPHGIY